MKYYSLALFLAIIFVGGAVLLIQGDPTKTPEPIVGTAPRVLTIPQGGTGTSTNPSNGQLLIGDADGNYELTATSSLGITADANIEVLDEGSTLTSSVSSIDFVGSAVTATNSGGDVTVTVTGTGSGGDPGLINVLLGATLYNRASTTGQVFLAETGLLSTASSTFTQHTNFNSLSASSTIEADGQILAKAGSAASPGYAFNNATGKNSGMYWTGAILTLVDSGDIVADFSGSGNGRTRMLEGDIANPGWTFLNDPDTGLSNDPAGSNILSVSAGGALSAQFGSASSTIFNGLTVSGILQASSTALFSSIFFDGVLGTQWSDFCVSITGSADLCDGSDDGAGGSGLTNYNAFLNPAVGLSATTSALAVGSTTPSIFGLAVQGNALISGSTTMNGLISTSSVHTGGELVTSQGLLIDTSGTPHITMRGPSTDWGINVEGGTFVIETGTADVFSIGGGNNDGLITIQNDRLGILDATPAATLTVGASDAFQVNSSGAIAAATGITSSGTITFSGLDCTGNANGGALTANGSGVISCTDDDSGSGGGSDTNWTYSNGSIHPSTTTPEFQVVLSDASSATTSNAKLTVRGDSLLMGSTTLNWFHATGTATSTISGGLAVANGLNITSGLLTLGTFIQDSGGAKFINVGAAQFLDGNEVVAEDIGARTLLDTSGVDILSWGTNLLFPQGFISQSSSTASSNLTVTGALSASSTLAVNGLSTLNGLTLSGNLTFAGDTIDELNGTGLVVSSGDLNVGAGTCITVNADDVAVTTNCTDAATVDSINGASLLRSDTSDSYTSGTLTFSGGTTLDTSAATLTVGTVTGAIDAGGATSLEIVNGASPTVNAVGEIAIDTTSGNLIAATSTNSTATVLASATSTLYAFTLASTSPEMIAIGGSLAGDVELPTHFLPQVITGVICKVVAGTSIAINISDGTNDSNSVTCTTTETQYKFTSNFTFTAYETVQLETATLSGAVDYLVVRLIGYRTSD